MPTPCPHCACTDGHGRHAHALLALLAIDDVDGALSLGLQDASACPRCDASCNARLLSARDARRTALAARSRYEARAARLARIDLERRASRNPAREPAVVVPREAPAIPKGAADALTRALAKAAGRA